MIRPTYVNTGRRDLIKKLAALGVVGIAAPVVSLTSCTNQKKTSLLNGTWKKDEGYEHLRKSMSAQANVPNRYPDIIVRPETETDILDYLTFANENDLQVVCRASGHNTAAAFLRNGGMLMDLSAFDAISIDPANRTAIVQPGTRFDKFVETITEYNFGFPYGDCGSVTFGGYLLGGGRGKNGNHYTKGPACYAILSADVILADGTKITANKDENQDIFWSIRGCGPGFFGIVTSYTIQLFDPLRTILQSKYTFEIDELESVIDFFDDHLLSKDDRVDIYIGLSDGEEGKTVCYSTITAFTTDDTDPIEKAKSLLLYYVDQGIREKSISSTEFKPVGLTDFLYYPQGMRTNVETVFTDNSKSILAMVNHYRDKPCMVIFELTHNSQMYFDQQRDDAAYSSKGRHYLNYYIIWDDEKLDDAARNWMDTSEVLLKPFVDSHYINMTDNARFPEHARKCFTEENWNKLSEIRKKYDPTNRFYTYLGLS